MSPLRTILQPIAIALALGFAVRATSIGIYSVPSASMNPTLCVGDTILVTPYVHGERPQHGDVIVFRSPSSRDVLMVKRVIAVAGDLVTTQDERVMISGHTLAEPYLRETKTSAIAPQVIAANRFFVLGDNRSNSSDSRQWGAIDSDDVIGRARLVLWSSPTPATPHVNATSLTPAGAPRHSALRLLKVVR